VAYTRWRDELGGSAPIVLIMIVDDIGIQETGQRFHRDRRTLKKLLISALDLWADIIGEVCKEIDEATLVASHAGLLG